ncbi:MAG: hypothetical protein KDN18_02800 [Verrucomicrobiae bacterium]|nr:hypothetical protein [Verrucomicrobiae bacterium]
MKNSRSWTRRRFVAASAVSLGGLNLLTSRKAAAQTGNGVVLGEGEHRYEVIHDWAKLPDKYTWQTTHNVAVDGQNRLYVIHEGRAEQTDHPSIFVFDEKGTFIKAFASEFQGGGHGLEVRKEAEGEFLYVTGYQQIKKIAKFTLDGEKVWEKFAPMASGVYAAGEDTKPEKVWGRDRFMPTNFAFLPDGGFFVADGYGSHTIQRYDAKGEWMQTIGKPGKEDGQFNLPHGVWIDDRKADEVQLVVADRANARLQWFDLDGKHLRTMKDFILPANVDRLGDLLLVPDLSARITLLDKDNRMIHLGEDPAWREQVLKDKMAMRRNPSGWVSGKFVHPHDACFDANGNIFVAEWVDTGRISKLRKVS